MTGLTLARSGLLTPTVPTPAVLGLLARAPFKSPNIGSAVAVHAALRPGATALIDDEGDLSWQGLLDRSRRLANALLDVGTPGDRVAFMLRNGRENVECYAACGLAGMTAVPVNTWSSRSDIEHIAQTQEPILTIADREFADALKGGDSTIWLVGDDGEYEAMLRRSSAAPPPVRGGARIVTHTSGTTGKPKGAERDVGGSQITSFVAFLEKVPLRRNDVFYLAPPLFHQFAQGMMGLGLVLGCTLVLRRKFDAADFMENAVATRATAAALLPVMLKRIIELPSDTTAPDLRLAVVSGSALPAALRKRAAKRLGDIFYDLYGSTEVGFATIATPRDHRRRPDSVGRPGRASRILIIDDDGAQLPAGEVGRIHVANGFAFEGYTGTEHDQSVVDGAIDIGDKGYLDEEGYLFVTGRSDDMIVSGGENIFPSEVEGVLERHDDIAENAVIGVDDEEYGQVLHAFVVAKDAAKLSEDDVIGFARDNLPRYKAPKKVTFIDELPRNAAGKVLKTELREQAGAAESGDADER
jgi:fatty-acyl-CoA synthase